MILIAESGATKTDWCAVWKDCKTLKVRTSGINVATMREAAIDAVVREAAGHFVTLDPDFGIREPVTQIHFYAAGLFVPEGVNVPQAALGLHGVLSSLFPGAEIEYASDLLDAARAVCGHEAGVAAILGTGSNSCLFDGKAIVKNVRSGGFILGDEGGGARLGKLFLADFLKGLVPEPVSGEFAEAFEVDYMTIVANVYRGEAPSGYLGSFAPWILARYDRNDYVRVLVDRNFADFFERALGQYDCKTYPVGVVGGFGYACRTILEQLGARYGIRFSTFLENPVEGLVDYHLGKK